MLSQAHTAAPPRYTQRLRCQLVLSSIHSIGAKTPWTLLVAAFKAGVLTYRQAVHWLEFQQSVERADALIELAPYLPAELLAEALIVARSIEASDDSARGLGALAPHLPAELEAQVLAEALDSGPVDWGQLRPRAMSLVHWPHTCQAELSGRSPDSGPVD